MNTVCEQARAELTMRVCRPRDSGLLLGGASALVGAPVDISLFVLGREEVRAMCSCGSGC